MTSIRIPGYGKYSVHAIFLAVYLLIFIAILIMSEHETFVYIAALERNGVWEPATKEVKRKTLVSLRKRYDYHPLAHIRGVVTRSFKCILLVTRSS